MLAFLPLLISIRTQAQCNEVVWPDFRCGMMSIVEEDTMTLLRQLEGSLRQQTSSKIIFYRRRLGNLNLALHILLVAVALRMELADTSEIPASIKLSTRFITRHVYNMSV